MANSRADIRTAGAEGGCMKRKVIYSKVEESLNKKDGKY